MFEKIFSFTKYSFSKTTFNFTGSEQIFEVKRSGNYLIECYGAQGAGRQSFFNSESGIGGKGGFAAGIINLLKGVKLFVYVGSVGESSNTSLALGGYNGGGAAFGTDYSNTANGGGGASDVRLIGGEWDRHEGLLSRIIVAGGGGGGGEESGETGGYGGGEIGGMGGFVGTGGVFGKGAHTACDGGGGGGGWIGGNTNKGSQIIPTSNDWTDSDGGSGGTGYIFTNDSEIYEGYLVDKKYQMHKIALHGDVNEGNGTVIIMYLGNFRFLDNTCRVSRKNNIISIYPII